MERLIETQSSLSEQINKLATNYNKDSASRKTKDYLEKRKEEVTQIYNEYKENDAELKTNPDIQHHPYKDERIEVQRTCEKVVADINKRLEALATTPTTSTNPPHSEVLHNDEQPYKAKTTLPKFNSSTNKNSSMEKLYKKQYIRVNHLNNLIAQAYNHMQEDKADEYLNQKIAQLNTTISKIDELNEEILLEATEENLTNDEYFINNIYSEISIKLEHCTAKLQQAVHKRPEDNKTNNSNQPQYKLQKIEIPKFNGEYQKWVSFHELFIKLVDQHKGLTSTHKMMYLKTHLEGAASKVIQHLQPTGDNYESAMAILTTRYQNKRLLVSTYINTIFALQNITTESAPAIRVLHDTVRENLHAVQNFGVDTSTWGVWLVPFLTKKLDNETLKGYEISLKNPKDLQTTDEFLEFLETRYQALQALKPQKTTTMYEKPRPSYFKQQSFNAVTFKKQCCILCSHNHSLEKCNKFNQLSQIERLQLINLHALCRRCLTTGHNMLQCNSGQFCKDCNGKHHSLLHTKQHTAAQATCATNDHQSTLLATALVKTTGYNGREELLRILLDTGSQTSFITTEAKQRLQLTGRRISAEIHGVGGQIAGKINTAVNILLQPRYPSNFSIEIEALVLNKITKNLPESKFQAKQWKHLNELLLADPNYNVPAPIDILLGADYYSQIIKPQMLKGYKNEPVAQLTEFGWIIIGRIATTGKSKIINISSHVSSTEIDEQLKRFWEQEELHPPRIQTKPEIECEKHFQNTHRRLSNGRYEVKIPFKKHPQTHLGESEKMAIARLLQVERRLSRDPVLRESYISFMREYKQLGHMEIMTREDEATTPSYYLPHHAVIKEDSTTTKLRVVFDASAKTTSGTSLNEIMLNGPTLQQELISIIMRWRKHEFVFKADIEKMFRQILINKMDQTYQRLLWRESPKERIQTFKLQTVTYGTTSATYLATKVLWQLAHDEQKKFPAAAVITQRDFYIDDLLSGADTLDEALEVQSQIIKLLNSGGFNLRKWASNNKQLTTLIPPDSREGGLCPIQIDDTIKTLGINWNPNTDIFEFKISSTDHKGEPTKRKILAEVAKLFDPLGWLAPVIIQAKLLMQNIWIAGVGWDEKLNTNLEQQWIKFKTSLSDIEQITLPRWIEHKQHGKNELHGFSDASEKAFAAVVYYKTTDKRGIPVVYLITAKTKVAHLRSKISLPRLELCGALLVAKLLKKVEESMNLEGLTVYAWTDSMITLGWIKGNPNKYKTFVANRISEIQSLMQPSQWHHVQSGSNPADIASRGISAHQLKNSHLWWHGPDWLKSSNYPLLLKPPEDAVMEELKTTCLVSSTLSLPTLIDYNRFSSALKIKRTVAFCYRFISTLKKHIHTNTEELPSYLTTDELERAHKMIIKNIQESEFADEIKSIQITKMIKNTSKLRSLNPFIDNDGLLRVGGRLQNAQLKYNQKHQMILPKDHVFSKLVTQEAHNLVLHGGIQSTLSQLRTKYWILNSKSLVSKTIRGCVKCFRFRRSTSEQLMGMLPPERITPCGPFTNTGIDYAGPFAIRVSKGRGTKSYKGYIALFVCFSTKAVHLELVSDLTTAAFLAAFKRFAARRGTPLNVYTDNGTNFVGARNDLDNNLKLAIKQANDNAAEQTAMLGTKWHFIPPASPHFGGLWESGIKSTKHHLKKIIGETTLTFEEFNTVLIQVEACLNSRPILPISNDLDDNESLTPGHFLIGKPLLSHPEPDITNINTTQRWALVSKMTQRFWKIWSMQYLTNLQQRAKWASPKANNQIGQLVLIREENLPPTKWSMGRIIDTHPGSDGLTRVVSIRGPKQTIFKRPITKICPLPTEDNQILSKELINGNSVKEVPSKHVDPNTNRQPTIPNTLTSNCMTTAMAMQTSQRRKRDTTKNQEEESSSKRTARNWMRGAIDPEIVNLASNLRPKPLQRKRTPKINPWLKSMLYTTTILSIMIPVSTTININSPPFNVTRFNNEPGIYFDFIGDLKFTNNNWNIIVYYNLTNYDAELCSYRRCINKLETFCQVQEQNFTNRTTSPGRDICSLIVPPFQQSLLELEHKNELLNHQKANFGRSKRGIFNIVGNLASDLFGVLDDRDAAHYEQQIENLKLNNNHLLELIKNQTSIIDATVNVFKRRQQDIDQHWIVFKGQLEQALESNDRNVNFLALSMHTLLLMSSFKDIQETLIEAVLDTHNQVVTTRLLTVQQLIGEVDLLTRSLPTEIMLPKIQDTDDILALYQLMTTKTKISGKYLIFELKIPLVYKEQYQIYKPISLPTTNVPSIFIRPRMELLITDLHRRTYSSMSIYEWQKCTSVNDLIICKLTHPIQQDEDAICEIQLLRQETMNRKCEVVETKTDLATDTWIQLQDDRWLFSIQGGRTVSIVCKQQPLSTRLSNSGIVSLGPGCSLQGTAINIPARQLYLHKIYSSILPTFNISTDATSTVLSHQERSYNFDNLTKSMDLTQIQSEIREELRNEANTLNFHDIHHYTLSYGLLALLLTIIICIVIRRVSTRRKPASIAPLGDIA